MPNLAELLPQNLQEELIKRSQEQPQIIAENEIEGLEKEPETLTVDEIFDAGEFLNEDSSQSVLKIPEGDLVDYENGLSKRVQATLHNRFEGMLPVLHFTNAKVGDELEELVSTGFVENFVPEGVKE